MIVILFYAALGLVIVFALAFNSLMLYALRCMRKQSNRPSLKNFLLKNLGFVGIIQVLFGYCVQLFGSLLYDYSVNLCKASGFFITLCGLVSITFIVILSFDICLHVCHPLKSIVYDSRKPYLFAVFGWLYGLVWAAAPFFGLGGYVVEVQKSCTLSWVQNSIKGKAFMFALFFSCYLLPLTAIGACFGCIHFNTKRKMASNFAAVSSTSNPGRLIKMVKAGNLRLCFFISFTFILAWTPYAVIGSYTFAVGYYSLPDELVLTAAMTAKCSAIFTPALYFYYNRAARTYMHRLLPCLAPTGCFTGKRRGRSNLPEKHHRYRADLQGGYRDSNRTDGKTVTTKLSSLQRSPVNGRSLSR